MGDSSGPGSTQQSRQQQPAAGPTWEERTEFAVGADHPLQPGCPFVGHPCPSTEPWSSPPAAGVTSSPWIAICPCPSWLVPSCSFLMCRTTAVALKACCGERRKGTLEGGRLWCRGWQWDSCGGSIIFRCYRQILKIPPNVCKGLLNYIQPYYIFTHTYTHMHSYKMYNSYSHNRKQYSIMCQASV